MDSKKKTIKIAVASVIAVIILIFVCIKLYNNRRIDSLDGFWESRGQEHYVAYIHGDTIDLFWFEDRAETHVAAWTSGFRISGHFTPPEPGFNNYSWDLTYDYNRTNAEFMDYKTIWHAAESLKFETNPLNLRFEYKDGKIIRYYDDGGTEVFYPSGRDHHEVEMKAAIYDMQHEISTLANPLKVGTVTELPLVGADHGTLLFVEVTNPNIFRINDPAMLFYDQPEDANRGECSLGCYIDSSYHAVLVATNSTGSGPSAPHSEFRYSEYGIEIVNYDEEPQSKPVSSTVHEPTASDPGSVDVNIHTEIIPTKVTGNGETEYPSRKVAVVFYKGDRIVGGGYECVTLDNTDLSVTVPIMTELEGYDDYDIFIY